MPRRADRTILGMSDLGISFPPYCCHSGRAEGDATGSFVSEACGLGGSDTPDVSIFCRLAGFLEGGHGVSSCDKARFLVMGSGSAFSTGMSRTRKRREPYELTSSNASYKPSSVES